MFSDQNRDIREHLYIIAVSFVFVNGFFKEKTVHNKFYFVDKILRGYPHVLLKITIFVEYLVELWKNFG